MSTPTDPREPSRPPIGGEELAAWLADDLDASAAARVERELNADPEARARLEAIADVVARLQALDAVEPPAGFSDRLMERLTDEGAVDPPAASPGAEVVALRPRATPSRWLAVGTAAAAILTVAVVVALRPTGTVPLAGGGDDTAARSSAESGEAELLTEEESADAPVDALEAPAAGTGEVREDAARAPAVPLLVEDGRELETMDDVLAHVAALPEVAAAGDLPSDVRAEAAALARDLVASAPPFSEDRSPGRCLDAGVAEGRLLVRVEALSFDGRPALLYVAVDGADAAAVVVDPSCATLGVGEVPGA